MLVANISCWYIENNPLSSFWHAFQGLTDYNSSCALTLSTKILYHNFLHCRPCLLLSGTLESELSFSGVMLVVYASVKDARMYVCC